jgi:hypothetical protein
MLSVAVGQTVYLNLKLSDATAEITAANVKTLTYGLRGLINEKVPATLVEKYGPSIQAIELVQTLDAATNVLNIQAFVPLPDGLNAADVKTFLMKQYVENPDVKKILSVVLPTLCGTCKLADITAEELSTGVTISPTPATSKIPKGFDRHKVGLKMTFASYTPLTEEQIKPKMAQIPTLLNVATGKLDDTTKAIIQDIFSEVKYSQPCQGTSPVACSPVLLFPKVPSTYVELYGALVKKYIVDNKDALTQAANAVPAVLGCGTGCKLESWDLFDEKVKETAAPTANPTAAPTVKETAAPTASPTASPTPKSAGGEGNPATTLFLGAASSVLVGTTALALL